MKVACRLFLILSVFHAGFGCATAEEVGKLRGQVRSNQSKALGEMRDVRAELQVLREQCQQLTAARETEKKSFENAIANLEGKLETLSEQLHVQRAMAEESRRQLAKLQEEQGKALAAYLSQAQSLIGALARGYQVEVENHRRYLREAEQAVKALEQLDGVSMAQH